MRTRVKDFIEISDHTSLDALISALTAVRDSLPATAEPQLKMRGDDVFGRRFSISYFRELTEEEAAIDARYSETHAAAQRIDHIRATSDSGAQDHRPRRRAA
jgi:hypothetical protein